MLGTLKKIFAFAGNQKGLLEKSLFFSFLNGIFASFQFGALYFIVDALASDNHSLTSVWLSLGMMILSVAGRCHLPESERPAACHQDLYASSGSGSLRPV